MPELISINMKKSSRICVARGMLKESSQPPSQSMFTLVCTYLDSQGELAASLFIVVGLCPVCQSRYRYRRFATKCFLCSCVVCISEVTVVLGTLGTLGQSGHSWELLGTLGHSGHSWALWALLGTPGHSGHSWLYTWRIPILLIYRYRYPYLSM